MDLIKWQLNIGSCNFGLNLNQIARVYFQTKLHDPKFNYYHLYCHKGINHTTSDSINELP